MRPCDRCGGTNKYQFAKWSDEVECVVCVDMPRLKCSELPGECEVTSFEIGGRWCETHEFGDRGFKPEPSTVMRWCQAHEASVLRGEETCWPVSIAMADGLDTDDCDIVWIKRPKALEVAP